MNLTYQIPMHYCYLQHQIWLSPPDTSTAECHSHFGPAASFFLELLVIALCSSPVAYWIPSNLREGSSSDVISFCLFILSMRFSRQEYWNELPFPSLVDHILSELFTMTCALGWPCMDWLMASPSYTGPFAMTRQWSVKGNIIILHFLLFSFWLLGYFSHLENFIFNFWIGMNFHSSNIEMLYKVYRGKS